MPSDPDEKDMAMRQRRLRFRAWHRGFKELDLILGQFVDKYGETLNASELASIEALMDAPDTDVYYWITGKIETPAEFNTPLMGRLQKLDYLKLPS